MLTRQINGRCMGNFILHTLILHSYYKNRVMKSKHVDNFTKKYDSIKKKLLFSAIKMIIAKSSTSVYDKTLRYKVFSS